MKRTPHKQRAATGGTGCHHWNATNPGRARRGAYLGQGKQHLGRRRPPGRDRRFAIPLGLILREVLMLPGVTRRILLRDADPTGGLAGCQRVQDPVDPRTRAPLPHKLETLRTRATESRFVYVIAAYTILDSSCQNKKRHLGTSATFRPRLRHVQTRRSSVRESRGRWPTHGSRAFQVIFRRAPSII